ncbi:hypothetical protein BpHYR1_050015 [Brachionus plicatilis]|uniref:Uncharacterized protein n=1 Tax=Brachionus plicatilis TaxID=10195 RepID=A0A3M7S1L4_BRAPC|nr:hypothetical protein BpHYR1_050015 [Brachionus plicatilis]
MNELIFFKKNIIIENVSSAIGYLTKSIKNFAQIIRILNHNGITKSKLFVNDDAESHNEIPIVETFFSDPYTINSAHSLVTDEFILKSVTSHLITNYYTIIVGKTSNLVNKMINTLAIFMPKEKIRLSCYAIQDYFMLSPNLILQGLVTENPEEFNSLLEADFLFKRDYPTTIINISNKTVCRTCTGYEFVQTKEQFINHKIKFLFNNLNLSQLKILHPANEYLNWISYSSNQPRLIKKMLQELELFESELEASHRTEKTIKIPSKKLTKILDISTDEDLNVVLAFAHNLKPDFFRNFIFTN